MAIDKYYEEVIKAGDETSGEFQTACTQANKEYSLASKLGILDGDTITIGEENTLRIKGAKDTIDGVGTKVQIYCNQFENIFQALKKGELDGATAEGQAIDLWYRMIMDLIAMNADDLRKGEIAILATDIIDINHLNGERGKFFQDTIKKAMRKAIQTTQIAITAGETAILGTNAQAKYAHKTIQQLLTALQGILVSDTPSNKRALELTQEGVNMIEAKLEEIEFNISGTALGLKTQQEKLVKLEDSYYDVIAFEEKAEDGIIGPRANGITKIRDDMNLVMGEGRENKTFEEFVEKIGIKAKKIPEKIYNVCKGKKLRDIATGTTTVFNPFIANELLGGFNGEPKARVAKLIHVTGNPLKKISEGIGDKNYRVDLNLGTVKIPQIIALLQLALDIPDDQAMNKWNMGVPYAIVANPSDRPAIAKLAEKHGYKTQVIGSVKKISEGEEDKKNVVRGVGIGKSTMEF